MNFLTVVTEFAAVSLASQQLGIPPVIAVPVAAAGLVLLVGTGSYRRGERMTLALCGLNLTWFALAGLVGLHWAEVVKDSVVPRVLAGGITSGLVFLVIAIVGTTIAP